MLFLKYYKANNSTVAFEIDSEQYPPSYILLNETIHLYFDSQYKPNDSIPDTSLSTERIAFRLKMMECFLSRHQEKVYPVAIKYITRFYQLNLTINQHIQFNFFDFKIAFFNFIISHSEALQQTLGFLITGGDYPRMDRLETLSRHDHLDESGLLKFLNNLHEKILLFSADGSMSDINYIKTLDLQMIVKNTIAFFCSIRQHFPKTCQDQLDDVIKNIPTKHPASLCNVYRNYQILALEPPLALFKELAIHFNHANSNIKSLKTLLQKHTDITLDWGSLVTLFIQIHPNLDAKNILQQFFQLAITEKSSHFYSLLEASMKFKFREVRKTIQEIFLLLIQKKAIHLSFIINSLFESFSLRIKNANEACDFLSIITSLLYTEEALSDDILGFVSGILRRFFITHSSKERTSLDVGFYKASQAICKISARNPRLKELDDSLAQSFLCVKRVQTLRLWLEYRSSLKNSDAATIKILKIILKNLNSTVQPENSKTFNTYYIVIQQSSLYKKFHSELDGELFKALQGNITTATIITNFTADIANCKNYYELEELLMRLDVQLQYLNCYDKTKNGILCLLFIHLLKDEKIHLLKETFLRGVSHFSNITFCNFLNAHTSLRKHRHFEQLSSVNQGLFAQYGLGFIARFYPTWQSTEILNLFHISLVYPTNISYKDTEPNNGYLKNLSIFFEEALNHYLDRDEMFSEEQQKNILAMYTFLHPLIRVQPEDFYILLLLHIQKLQHQHATPSRYGLIFSKLAPLSKNSITLELQSTSPTPHLMCAELFLKLAEYWINRSKDENTIDLDLYLSDLKKMEKKILSDKSFKSMSKDLQKIFKFVANDVGIYKNVKAKKVSLHTSKPKTQKTQIRILPKIEPTAISVVEPPPIVSPQQLPLIITPISTPVINPALDYTLMSKKELLKALENGQLLDHMDALMELKKRIDLLTDEKRKTSLCVKTIHVLLKSGYLDLAIELVKKIHYESDQKAICKEIINKAIDLKNRKAALTARDIISDEDWKKRRTVKINEQLPSLRKIYKESGRRNTMMLAVASSSSASPPLPLKPQLIRRNSVGFNPLMDSNRLDAKKDAAKKLLATTNCDYDGVTSILFEYGLRDMGKTNGDHHKWTFPTEVKRFYVIIADSLEAGPLAEKIICEALVLIDIRREFPFLFEKEEEKTLNKNSKILT